MLQQVAASKSLLEALRARPGFTDASAAEASRLMQLFPSVAMTSEQLAAFAAAVTDVHFAPKDEGDLLDAISRVASGRHTAPVAGSTANPRTRQQDWESILDFLPASVWQAIKESRIDVALDFLFRMGLRNPSEPTIQKIALGMMVVTEGFEQALEKDVQQKLALHKTVKGLIANKVKYMPKPVVWIQQLSASPALLQRDFPTVFESLYTSEQAVPSPLSVLQIEQLKRTSRMRKERGNSSLSLVSFGSQMQQMQQMPQMPQPYMQMGMAIMSELTQLKQQMSQSASSGEVPAPGGRQIFKLLTPSAPSALEGQQQQQQRLCLEDRPAPSAEIGASAAAAAPSAVTGASAAAAAPSAVTGASQAAAAAPPAGASGAEPPLDAITTEILNKMKAKAAGKPKAKAKGKAKGKDKAVPTLPATTIKAAKGKAKAVPTLPTTTIKAKAKGAKVVWHKSCPDLEGCARCRNAAWGCDKCRAGFSVMVRGSRNDREWRSI